MSAYMLQPAHFDALADYASRKRMDFYMQPDAKYLSKVREVFGEYVAQSGSVNLAMLRSEVGQVLHAENARSIEARYPDTKTNNSMGNKTPYAFRSVDKPLTGPGALAALRSYTYQSCESDDWTDTLAFAICEAIRDEAIREVTDGLPRSLTEADVRVDFAARLVAVRGGK